MLDLRRSICRSSRRSASAAAHSNGIVFVFKEEDRHGIGLLCRLYGKVWTVVIKAWLATR